MQLLFPSVFCTVQRLLLALPSMFGSTEMQHVAIKPNIPKTNMHVTSRKSESLLIHTRVTRQSAPTCATMVLPVLGALYSSRLGSTETCSTLQTNTHDRHALLVGTPATPPPTCATMVLPVLGAPYSSRLLMCGSRSCASWLPSGRIANSVTAWRICGNQPHKQRQQQRAAATGAEAAAAEELAQAGCPAAESQTPSLPGGPDATNHTQTVKSSSSSSSSGRTFSC